MQGAKFLCMVHARCTKRVQQGRACDKSKASAAVMASEREQQLLARVRALEAELEMAQQRGPSIATGEPLEALGPLSMSRSVKVRLSALEPVRPGGEGVDGTMYELTGPSKLLKTLAQADLPTLGSLSPISKVTLPPDARRAANIHEHAVWFAWAYPLAGVAQMTAEQAAIMSPENVAAHSFIAFGGFVYFDEDGNFLQLNALDPGDGLYFSGPFRLPADVKAELRAQGRFQPVSAGAIRESGALNFCWIVPDEPTKARLPTDNSHGSFAYDYGGSGSNDRYFTVVHTPEEATQQNALAAQQGWTLRTEHHV